MKFVGLIGGLMVFGMPIISMAEQKPKEDYTTVTQALENVVKNVPNSKQQSRAEIFAMDKSWGTDALLFIYDHNKDLLKDKNAQLITLEGLIRLNQLNDPRVRKVLTENKDHENVGFWIVELLNLDNSENEKKARAILDGYSAETDDELVQKSLITLLRKPELLKPYKNVLVKIFERADKGASSPRFAVVGLGQSGEISTLFDLYEKSASVASKEMVLNALTKSYGIMQSQANSDSSLRNHYFLKYRTIISNEKDENLRSSALRGFISLLDNGTHPGSDADIRKYLEEISTSTTESQKIKDFAEMALHRR